MDEELKARDLELEQYSSLTDDMRDSITEQEQEDKDWLAEVHRKNDELEKFQGLTTAEYQANLIDAVNKLSPVALNEALGMVEPSKAGIVWHILEERRAD